MILKELNRIPARVRNEEMILDEFTDMEGNSEFAFGIETNLAGTPAMDKLWEYISKSKEESKLQLDTPLENISKSLHLDDTDNWFFDNVLISAIAEYRNEYPIRFAGCISMMVGADHNVFSGNEKAPFVLNSIWVNFQKQHEFIPMHHHTGLFSFVIMMKIPYDWKEQHEIPFVKASNSARAGNFEFVYIDVMGNICTYSLKLSSISEGTMLFFPAEMMHQVYPFYNCEEERITISGNIKYDI